MLDFEERSALVVGGGQGMGRATALALAARGARVAVVDAERERAEAVGAELAALGKGGPVVVADVTDRGGADAMVASVDEDLGGIDVVANIVGGASWKSLLDMDEATWNRDFAVNLTQHLHVGRAAARCWIERGQPGALCVVASVSGESSAANHAAYGAAKAGVLSFVRSAAEEWWPHNIRVNAVVPGAVRTPRIEASWEDGSVPRPTDELLGRMAMPDDIANAILFLLSDLAGKVTGQALRVDGGWTTRFPYGLE